MVTGSVECDICESWTQRGGIFPPKRQREENKRGQFERKQEKECLVFQALQNPDQLDQFVWFCVTQKKKKTCIHVLVSDITSGKNCKNWNKCHALSLHCTLHCKTIHACTYSTATSRVSACSEHLLWDGRQRCPCAALCVFTVCSVWVSRECWE